MSVFRGLDYLRKHGFRATLERFATEIKRRSYRGNHQLYYCDLPIQIDPPKDARLVLEEVSISNNSSIEPIRKHWNETKMSQLIDERFHLGAKLWAARYNGKLAAYGWTLQGNTVDPHFFTLTLGDVHFFDFLVFPEFRGLRINPFLVTAILDKLGDHGERRALIECATWNVAQIKSLAKTPFKKMGIARKRTRSGKIRVTWTLSKANDSSTPSSSSK